MGLSNYLPNSRINQAGVCTSSTRPASPYEGQVIYETDTDRVLVWNNSAWVDPSTGQTQRSGIVKIVPSSATNGTVATNGDVTISSSVASVTVNGAFSSSFSNYQIRMWGSQSVSGVDLRFALGTSTTGSAYFGSYYYDTYLGNGTGTSRSNNATYALIGGITTSNNEQSLRMDIFRPFESERTSWHGQAYGNGFSFWHSGTQASTTSFSAFTISPFQGNFSGGVIQVYGYN